MREGTKKERQKTTQEVEQQERTNNKKIKELEKRNRRIRNLEIRLRDGWMEGRRTKDGR